DHRAKPAAGDADVDDVLPAEHLTFGFHVPVRGDARLGAMDRRVPAAHPLPSHRARHHAQGRGDCGSALRYARARRPDADCHDHRNQPLPAHVGLELFFVGAGLRHSGGAPSRGLPEIGGLGMRTEELAHPGRTARRCGTPDAAAQARNHHVERVHVPRMPRAPSMDCECSPPGSEMPHNALPALAAPSVRAMSPSERIPTKRFSWLSTGSRRSLMSAIFCTMSSRSSSSKQYMTSLLMISRIGVCGPLSAPMARMAMSRSVIMPTSRSSSPTGNTPASICAIRRAASRIDWLGLAILTSLVIASLTCMAFSPHGLERLRTGARVGRRRRVKRQVRRGGPLLRSATRRGCSPTAPAALSRPGADRGDGWWSAGSCRTRRYRQRSCRSSHDRTAVLVGERTVLSAVPMRRYSFKSLRECSSVGWNE